MKEKFFRFLGVVGMASMLMFTFSGAFAAEMEVPEIKPEDKAVEAIDSVIESVEAEEKVKDVEENVAPKNTDKKSNAETPKEVENNAVAKIYVCHATSSETNPWELLHLPVNALAGHGEHENDIIDVGDTNGDGVMTEADCGEPIGGGCPLIDNIVLKSPANYAENLDSGVVLDWEDVEGATKYMVEVSTSPSFVGGHTYSSYTEYSDYTLSDLEYGKTHYWRVTAINESYEDCKKVSSVWSFTTKCLAEEPCPPVNGDNGGIGGGVVVVPVEVPTIVSDGGIGGGTFVNGIGGGTLPETGSPWTFATLIMSLLGAAGAVFKFKRLGLAE